MSRIFCGEGGGQFVRVSLEAGNLNIKINTKIADKCALYIKTVFIKKQLQISKLINASCGTVALYGLFIKKKFLADSIKNLRNSYQEYVAPFNSNYHNKTLCESGVMWIFRFVTYLSIVFHIYLCIIIHF